MPGSYVAPGGPYIYSIQLVFYLLYSNTVAIIDISSDELGAYLRKPVYCVAYKRNNMGRLYRSALIVFGRVCLFQIVRVEHYQGDHLLNRSRLCSESVLYQEFS